MPRKNPKTALVTGASSGIGEAIAQRLMKEGWRVYAAARRQERMVDLAAAGAKLLPLDLTDDASMVKAMQTIAAEAGALDALINNAGYGSYGALEEVTLDEARRQFDVNVFGLARLIQLALPAMRARKKGAILNITSIGGKLAMPFGGWYHASKYAVEALSDSLRQELKPFNIKVIVIEPGAIKTEWSAIAGEHLLAASAGGAYAQWAGPFAGMLQNADRAVSFADPPEAVAKVVARALSAWRPRTRYGAGGGATMFLTLTWLLSDRFKDRIVRMMSRSLVKAAAKTAKTA